MLQALVSVADQTGAVAPQAAGGAMGKGASERREGGRRNSLVGKMTSACRLAQRRGSNVGHLFSGLVASAPGQPSTPGKGPPVRRSRVGVDGAPADSSFNAPKRRMSGGLLPVKRPSQPGGHGSRRPSVGEESKPKRHSASGCCVTGVSAAPRRASRSRSKSSELPERIHPDYLLTDRNVATPSPPPPPPPDVEGGGTP